MKICEHHRKILHECDTSKPATFLELGTLDETGSLAKISKTVTVCKIKSLHRAYTRDETDDSFSSRQRF
jgi:hypothetical protein